MEKGIYIRGLNIPVVIKSYKKSKTVKILYKDGYLKVTKPYWYNQKNVIKYLEENCEKIKSEYIKFSNKKEKDENITEILYLGNIYNVCLEYNNKDEDIFFDGNNICIKVKEGKITNDELRNIIKS